MNKILSVALFGFGFFGITACVTQPNMPMKYENMPVVLYGNKSKVKNSNFITFIPSGTKIPFNLEVKGNVFRENVKKSFPVILKDDTYFYSDIVKNPKEGNLWISYDKKHWYTMEEAFNGMIGLGVDMQHDSASISLGFEANRKNVK